MPLTLTDRPPVAIIMGSQSDWETMKNAADTLEALEIPYEARIISAHRTPERHGEFRQGRAATEGFKVIIAGAGGAAHLPGMTAALTPLPVFGVPVQSKALSGQDSLLSIVQMPGRHSGRHSCDRQGRRNQRRTLGRSRSCAFATRISPSVSMNGREAAKRLRSPNIPWTNL